jgi:predicted HAD superfamily Cof-like phosphohydrolase
MRPFNRDKDFNHLGIDSAKAFKMINQNNLDKRFASGSSSFL